MNGFAQQAYSMDNSTKMSGEVINGFDPDIVVVNKTLVSQFAVFDRLREVLEVLPGLEVLSGLAIQPNILHPHLLTQMHVHGKQVLVVTNTTITPLYLDKTIWALTDGNLNVKVESDGHDAESSKQSTSDMTAFGSKPAPANDGEPIDELEQSINDLRAEMGQEGYISPPAQLKSKEEPRSADDG
ncbi:hypothetical protein OROGR_023761 [Orobanche gracilis]